MPNLFIRVVAIFLIPGLCLERAVIAIAIQGPVLVDRQCRVLLPLEFGYEAISAEGQCARLPVSGRRTRRFKEASVTALLAAHPRIGLAYERSVHWMGAEMMERYVAELIRRWHFAHSTKDVRNIIRDITSHFGPASHSFQNLFRLILNWVEQYASETAPRQLMEAAGKVAAQDLESEGLRGIGGWPWETVPPRNIEGLPTLDLASSPGVDQYLGGFRKDHVVLVPRTPFAATYLSGLVRRLRLAANVIIRDADVRHPETWPAGERYKMVRMRNLAQHVQDLTPEWVGQVADRVAVGGSWLIEFSSGNRPLSRSAILRDPFVKLVRDHLPMGWTTPTAGSFEDPEGTDARPINFLEFRRSAALPETPEIALLQGNVYVQFDTLLKTFEASDPLSFCSMAAGVFRIAQRAFPEPTDPGRAEFRRYALATLMPAVAEDPEMLELFRRAAKFPDLRAALKRGRIGPHKDRNEKAYLSKRPAEVRQRLKLLQADPRRSRLAAGRRTYMFEAEFGDILGYKPEDVLLFGVQTFMPHNGTGTPLLTIDDLQSLVESWRDYSDLSRRALIPQPGTTKTAGRDLVFLSGFLMNAQSARARMEPLAVEPLPDGSVVVGIYNHATHLAAIYHPDGSVMPLLGPNGESISTCTSLAVDERGHIFLTTIGPDVSEYSSDGKYLRSIPHPSGETIIYRTLAAYAGGLFGVQSITKALYRRDLATGEVMHWPVPGSDFAVTLIGFNPHTREIYLLTDRLVAFNVDNHLFKVSAELPSTMRDGSVAVDETGTVYMAASTDEMRNQITIFKPSKEILEFMLPPQMIIHTLAIDGDTLLIGRRGGFERLALDDVLRHSQPSHRSRPLLNSPIDETAITLEEKLQIPHGPAWSEELRSLALRQEAAFAEMAPELAEKLRLAGHPVAGLTNLLNLVESAVAASDREGFFDYLLHESLQPKSLEEEEILRDALEVMANALFSDTVSGRAFLELVVRFIALQNYALELTGELQTAPYPENALTLMGAACLDLAAGINFSHYLSRMNPLTPTIAVDRSIFVAPILRALAALHGRPDVTVVQEDVLEMKQPSIPLGIIRIKNVAAYVPLFTLRLREMAGWLLPGGELRFELELEKDAQGMREHFLHHYASIITELIDENWITRYIPMVEESERITRHGLEALILTKPEPGFPVLSHAETGRGWAAFLRAA